MSAGLLQLIDRLHAEKCSCVIYSHGQVTLCHERGVTDLYRLLTHTPHLLDGALIADKVIGKGAAALMMLGGVKEVYADVISKPALDLLKSGNIFTAYALAVPHIINRSGTGICPVESLCEPCTDARSCLPLIQQFINSTSQSK